MPWWAASGSTQAPSPKRDCSRLGETAARPRRSSAGERDLNARGCSRWRLVAQSPFHSSQTPRNGPECGRESGPNHGHTRCWQSRLFSERMATSNGFLVSKPSRVAGAWIAFSRTVGSLTLAPGSTALICVQAPGGHLANHYCARRLQAMIEPHLWTLPDEPQLPGWTRTNNLRLTAGCSAN